MRTVSKRHDTAHWSASAPADHLITAARRWMLVGIVVGVALCLACCGAVAYGLL